MGLGILWLVISTIMTAVMVRNRILSRIAGKHLNNKLNQFDKQGHYQYPFYINPKMSMIIQLILNGMDKTLKPQGQKTRDHLFRYQSILFRTKIHLPIRADDPDLYCAIDVIKQMFYRMYGIYRDPHTQDMRNHMDLNVQLADGQDISHLVSQMSLEQALHNLRMRDIPAQDDDRGLFIVVNMSVATPATPKNYNYARYCP